MAIIDRNSILFEGPLTASVTGPAVALNALKLPGRMEPMPLRLSVTQGFKPEEVQSLMPFAMDPVVFRQNYDQVKSRPGKLWEQTAGAVGTVYDWPKSTYIARPPFFDDFAALPGPIPEVRGARVLGAIYPA